MTSDPTGTLDCPTEEPAGIGLQQRSSDSAHKNLFNRLKLKNSDLQGNLSGPLSGRCFRSERTGSEDGVRKIIAIRSERGKVLPAHLFADPAWDMLLDLYLSDILSKRISVSSLCSASNVPATTALRWITELEGEGLVNRTADPTDRRRCFTSLSDKGLAAMDSIFGSPAALFVR